MYLASVHYFVIMVKSKKKQNCNFVLKQRDIWIPSFHFILSCCFAVPWMSFELLLRGRLNHPMLIIAVLMLSKLEDKKELHKEVKSQWSALRGFNWQHSKFYIIPQSTDLFCHTILLTKLNMLTSFSPHFLANIERAYTPTWFSSGASIVSPPKNMVGPFH